MILSLVIPQLYFNVTQIMKIYILYVFIQATSPSQSAEVSGHMTSESPYTLTLTTSRNMKPTWKTVWSVNTEKRTLDASMTYGTKFCSQLSFPYFLLTCI